MKKYKLNLDKISDYNKAESYWIIKLYENKNKIIGVINNELCDKKYYNYGDVIEFDKNTNLVKIFN